MRSELTESVEGMGNAMTETSPRIARLLRDLAEGGGRVVEDFWREMVARGAPLVEEVEDSSALVTFVWRGEAAYTATAWGIEVELSRIPGTDLWYGSRRLPVDLRTIYYLRHCGDAIPTSLSGTGASHIDILNPCRVRFPADRSDPNDRPHFVSLLELPAAPTDRWSRPRPGVARGSLMPTSIRTEALGGRRRIVVYRPAAVTNEVPALLVVFDGFRSRAVLRMPTTLDNLIGARRIPPTMALFVNAPSGERRSRELRPGARIRNFVLRELMPWAQRRWEFSEDPRRRVVAGSSLGGLAAAYVALVAPHVFGGVIAQSGSFWWPASPSARPEWLTRAYASRPRLPLRFYLDVGNGETISPPGNYIDQVTVNRRLRDVLVEHGYPVSYAEYSGGHDYVNWRRTFADGLIAVLGSPAPSVSAHRAPGHE